MSVGIRRVFTDAAINKVSDADFQTVMENVGFKETPREVVTVGDMESHYLKSYINSGLDVDGDIIDGEFVYLYGVR